jgi:hypothetical protein
LTEEVPLDQTERQRPWSTAAKVAIAVLAGLVVLVLLFPASGLDSSPPVCYSVLGYTVPCGGGLAVVAGTATAAAIGLLFWIVGQVRHRR